MQSVKTLLPLALVGVALSACHTPEGDAWDKAHHVGEINWTGTPGVISTSPSYPYNNKDYPDPHPHSASDDAQRAAYIQHQQDQQREQQGQSSPGPSMPDLSKMSCSGSSNVVTAANAGMMTSSSSCHN
jgi:hypothetical protein